MARVQRPSQQQQQQQHVVPAGPAGLRASKAKRKNQPQRSKSLKVSVGQKDKVRTASSWPPRSDEVNLDKGVVENFVLAVKSVGAGCDVIGDRQHQEQQQQQQTLETCHGSNSIESTSAPSTPSTPPSPSSSASTMSPLALAATAPSLEQAESQGTQDSQQRLSKKRQLSGRSAESGSQPAAKVTAATSTSTDPVPSTSKNSVTLTKDILRVITCPICTYMRRKGPLYQCRAGHMLCQQCREKVTTCPQCRDTHLDSRNTTAEQIRDIALEGGGPQPCCMVGQGCKFEADPNGPELEEHEAQCVHRTVACMGRLRGACSWTGPLHGLVRHVVEKKCVQIIKISDEQTRYVSVIGDFNNNASNNGSNTNSNSPTNAESVIGRRTATHWKPILLVSNAHIRLFAFLVVLRDAAGQWMLQPRCFAGPELRRKYRATVTVRRPKKDGAYNNCNGKPEPESEDDEAEGGGGDRDEYDDAREWTFSGELTAADAPEREARDRGQFLLLADAQIKSLKRGKTLFEYSVELTERPKRKAKRAPKEEVKKEEPEVVAKKEEAAETAEEESSEEEEQGADASAGGRENAVDSIAE